MCIHSLGVRRRYEVKGRKEENERRAAHTREQTSTHDHRENACIPAVEVLNGLRRLEGRIRVPDLASLRQDGLARLRVCGIGGDTLLDQAGLDGDDAHGDATQLGAE